MTMLWSITQGSFANVAIVLIAMTSTFNAGLFAEASRVTSAPTTTTETALSTKTASAYTTYMDGIPHKHCDALEQAWMACGVVNGSGPRLLQGLTGTLRSLWPYVGLLVVLYLTTLFAMAVASQVVVGPPCQNKRAEETAGVVAGRDSKAITSRAAVAGAATGDQSALPEKFEDGTASTWRYSPYASPPHTYPQSNGGMRLWVQRGLLVVGACAAGLMSMAWLGHMIL